MLITKQIEIDLAHRVLNHKSKCKNLHGHRYKIEVGVDDKVIDKAGASDEGMVIDFSDLKQIMMEEIDAVYDHNSIFYHVDPILLHLREYQKMEYQNKQIIEATFVPTAENLAKHWYELIKPSLADKGIKIAHLTVWETPTSTATYKE